MMLTRFAVIMCIGLLVCSRQASADNVQISQPVQNEQVPPERLVIDDASGNWTWTNMVSYEDVGLRGGTAHAGGSGCSATITFQGTGVCVYTMRGPAVEVNGRAHKIGLMQVTLDNKPVGSQVQLQRPRAEYDYPAVSAEGISPGDHTLRIESASGWVVVDSIAIINSPVVSTPSTRLSNRPFVSGTTGYPAATTPPSPADASNISLIRPAAAAKPPLIPEGNYRLVPRSMSNKYLSIIDMPVNGRTLMCVAERGASSCQIWHFTPLGDEQYKISPIAVGDRAILISLPEEQGSKAIVAGYGGGPNQRLVIKPGEAGSFAIGRADNPTWTLEVGWNATQSADPLKGNAYHHGNNQEWWLQSAMGGQ